MTKESSGSTVPSSSSLENKSMKNLRRPKLGVLLSDPNITFTSSTDHESHIANNHDYSDHHRSSNVSYPSSMMTSSPPNNMASPYFMSPFNQPSPYTNSPWINLPAYKLNRQFDDGSMELIGSLVREEGHIYSLASSGDLLYTGSDSKNIRVWKKLMEFSGFKSSSGLVKAIVVSGDRIFTGHQDGKIRVWRYSDKRKKAYKRVGNLPTTADYIKSSMNPSNYVEVRRHRNIPWIRHYDAISCMSLDEEQGLLYSGSWDKSFKVWRLSDSKCLESVNAHEDAINSVMVGFDGLVLTGSADGSVKVWRRELVGKSTRHVLVYTLLEQDNAVTALVVNTSAATAYAGSSDGLVNFWESEKSFLVHGGVLRGHKLAVLCLATAGTLLFSGSADKSICVWRRESGGVHSCLSVLTGHSGPVKCLAVQENQGDRDDVDDDDDDDQDQDQRWILYSGSLDRSVKLWRVSERPDMMPLIKAVSS